MWIYKFVCLICYNDYYGLVNCSVCEGVMMVLRGIFYGVMGRVFIFWMLWVIFINLGVLLFENECEFGVCWVKFKVWL